jgi:hypothetical protein
MVYCTGKNCPVRENCMLFTTQPVGVSKVQIFTEVPGRIVNVSDENKRWICDKQIILK